MQASWGAQGEELIGFFGVAFAKTDPPSGPSEGKSASQELELLARKRRSLTAGKDTYSTAIFGGLK